MSDNGGSIDIVRVQLINGKMYVKFGGSNIALNSHAIRLASLELDNKIIEDGIKKATEGIQVPKGLIR